MIAPAIQPSSNPCALPIPINAIPIVAIVVHELPVMTEISTQIMQVDERKKLGWIIFGSDALSGGSQVSLLTTTAVCILIGMAFYKIPWKDYELAITNNVAGVTTAILMAIKIIISLYFLGT